MRLGTGGSAREGGRNRMRPKVRGGGTVRLPPSFPCPSSPSHSHQHSLTASALFADYKVDGFSLSLFSSTPIPEPVPVYCTAASGSREPGARSQDRSRRDPAVRFFVRNIRRLARGHHHQLADLQAHKATGSGMRDGPASPRDQSPHRGGRALAPGPSSHAPLRRQESGGCRRDGYRLQATETVRGCEGARVQTETWAAVSPSGPHFFFLGVFGSHAAAAAHG